MKPQHFIELLLLSAIWGASFLFMRITANELDTFALASFRMVIAAATLLPLFLHFWLRRQQRPLSSQADVSTLDIVKRIFIVSLTNAILPMYLYAYAAANINSGFASILNATTPLWGAVIAALLFANRLSRWSLIGLIVGFIGVILLSLNKIQGQLDAELFSVIAIVSATCMYGFSANYAKHKLTGVPPLFIASASLFIGAIVTLPLTLWSLPQLFVLSSTTALSLVALGALSTGLAYVFYYRIIAHSGADKAMMVTYLIPVFGVLLGWLFLQEQIHHQMIYGGALILLGVAITTGAFGKKSV